MMRFISCSFYYLFNTYINYFNYYTVAICTKADRLEMVCFYEYNILN
jgi:hypothetical protein